jgi:hypothetical protein
VPVIWGDFVTRPTDASSPFTSLPCGCKAVACNTGYRIEDWAIGCPKKHERGDLTKQVYVLEQTVTERYFYDPVALAQNHGVTTADEVIELFEKHDGSVYCDELFYNDANPSVGVELVTRWDDD